MSQVLVQEPAAAEVEETVQSNLEQIPERIQSHIREITRTSGLEDSAESVEKIAGGWLEKQKLFSEQIAAMGMEEVEELDKDCPDGALAMTWSGSLVNLGPVKDDGRKVEYSSIGLRADVPEAASSEGSELSDSITVDNPINFVSGPVKSTSPIHKIAVCRGDLDADAQEEKINNATMLLKEEFVNVNKTIVLD